jgi:molybdopterin synthase sulfur carrier subunit
MARVSIKFFANVKEAVGKESMEIDIDDHETLENILRYLCEKFGERLRKIIFKDDSAVMENLIVFVNGENIVAKEGLKTKVNDGDQLIFLTPIAGG